MVKAFQFARIPKIIFRNGGIDDLVSITKDSVRSLILVTGKSSFFKSHRAEKLLDSFLKAGILVHKISIEGEPSPEVVDQTIRDFHDKKIDIVVGIGGGSVLDAGKAISAMMYKQESVAEFLEGVGNMEHPGTKLPYIAVPTTAGTGSEATRNAVISKTGLNGFKKSLRHDNLVPDVALVDPELTLSCPREITAACGMDCFTQLTESYLSDKSGPMTDALAFEGLKAIRNSLKDSYLNGDNLEARSGMSFAALASGICLANAGLGTVHGFASSIGGMYNIPHGVVCARLMAKTNELNVKELRKTQSKPEALNKYALMGKLFLGQEDRTDKYYIDGFINYLLELTGFLKLPRLKTFGLEEKDIDLICSKTENKNNPVALNNEHFTEILSGCL